jgi:CheY-like chemotaxis protein
MREYLTRLLVGSGYAVEAVTDGEAALAAAARAKPDLVLTDVAAPRRIRAALGLAGRPEAMGCARYHIVRAGGRGSTRRASLPESTIIWSNPYRRASCSPV